MSDWRAVELDPWTRESLIARARDPKRERWLEQVRRTGLPSSGAAARRGAAWR